MARKGMGEPHKRSPKLKTITVTCAYDNAHNIKEGDQFTIRPGSDFENGQLVAFRRWKDIDEITVSHLYRGKGKVWKYYTKDDPEMRRRTMLHARNLEILGPVVGDTRPAQEKKAEKRNGTIRTHTNYSIPLHGIHKGDDIIVERGGEPKIGDLILWECAECDGNHLSRVCLVNEQAIRCAGAYMEDDATTFPGASSLADS
jgi:hypothetical protein